MSTHISTNVNKLNAILENNNDEDKKEMNDDNKSIDNDDEFVECGRLFVLSSSNTSSVITAC